MQLKFIGNQIMISEQTTHLMSWVVKEIDNKHDLLQTIAQILKKVTRLIRVCRCILICIECKDLSSLLLYWKKNDWLLMMLLLHSFLSKVVVYFPTENFRNSRCKRTIVHCYLSYY